jgi:hypothetical protein
MWQMVRMVIKFIPEFSELQMLLNLVTMVRPQVADGRDSFKIEMIAGSKVVMDNLKRCP